MFLIHAKFNLKLLIFVIIFNCLFGYISTQMIETIILNETNSAPQSIANFTKILSEKYSISSEKLKKIKIEPIDKEEIYPFLVLNGNILSIYTVIDREAICKKGAISKVIKDKCNFGECCKLLSFQYFDNDVKNLFILIKINDINDNPPIFKPINRPFYRISESANEGTVIELPLADDIDSDIYGVQHYQINKPFIKGNGGDFQFKLRNKKPILIVNSLDYEKCSIYEFELTAFDFHPIKDKSGFQTNNGNQDSVFVEIEVIDENDNRPKFNEDIYIVDIKENEVKDKLIEFKIEDKDNGKNGRVSVTLKGNDKLVHKFQISQNGGNEGYVNLINALDYETDPSYFELKMVAKDHGTPRLSSTATIKISVRDINDNKPEISFSQIGSLSKNKFTIIEGVKEQSLVLLVRVSDADSDLDQINCHLMNYKHLFHLQKSSRLNLLKFIQYQLKTSSEIDRESHDNSFIRLTVECSDGDQIKRESVTIQILDVNDNAPVFSQSTYVGKVEENKYQEVVKFQKPLLAEDRDSENNKRIEYRIKDISKSNNDSQLFICDKMTGKILTKDKLDYEVKNSYIFMIVASDKGIIPLSSSASVIVNVEDVNDNAAIFDSLQYTFNVSENSKIGTEIGRVQAQDLDSLPVNKDIIYSIKSSNRGHSQSRQVLDSVVLDKRSGILSTAKALDREAYDSISFIVLAQNSKRLTKETNTIASESHVLIKITDVNDNPPKFQLRSSNRVSRMEFIIESNNNNINVADIYNNPSNCKEIPYILKDADTPDNNDCCTVSLENDFNGLFKLLPIPLTLCITRRPTKFISKTITIVAQDKPDRSQLPLTTKITIPVIIKANMQPLLPRTKTTDNRQFPNDNSDSHANTIDSKNFIIICILVTVVLVFVVIVIIIIFIFRRCSLVDQIYETPKSNQILNSTVDREDNKKRNYNLYEISHNMSQQSMQSHPQCSSMNTLQYTSSPQTLYHPLIHSPGTQLRIIHNPEDPYSFEWANNSHPNNVMTHHNANSDSQLIYPQTLKMNAPTSSSDNGYQILNSYHNYSPDIILPQSMDTIKSNNNTNNNNTMFHEPIITSDSMSYNNNSNNTNISHNNNINNNNNTISNNNNNNNNNTISSIITKTTPQTMKRNYFQTTFV